MITCILARLRPYPTWICPSPYGETVFAINGSNRPTISSIKVDQTCIACGDFLTFFTQETQDCQDQKERMAQKETLDQEGTLVIGDQED